MSILDRIAEWVTDAEPGDQATVTDEDGQVQYTITLGERMPAVENRYTHITIPHEHRWTGETMLCDSDITLRCSCGATMTEPRMLSDEGDDTEDDDVADVGAIG